MSDQNFNPDNTDLDRLHSAVKREKADLPPGSEPAPMWVMFLGFIAAVLAGGQMGSFSGYGLESVPTYGAIQDPRSGGGPQIQLSPFDLAMKKGETAYGTCNGCHQATGLGTPGAFPPLAGSDWAMGGTERLIRVVLHGLSGQITVSGKPFTAPAPMPGWGATMTDDDIANALTYVRNSWGNKASMVTPDMVAKVRGTEKARTAAWTQAELEPYAKKDVAGDAPPAK